MAVNATYPGNSNMKVNLNRKQTGVTLLELLIVVAIVAMISAFAYPSYMQYVTRAKRTAATTMLLQVADRQQQFFMDNKRYAGNLTRLGFAADTITVDEDGQVVPADDGDQVYTVTISGSTNTTYTLTAAPQLAQATKDTKCGSLTLTQTGQRGYSGTGGECW
jgi:type IV pilus assembly protein PilE